MDNNKISPIKRITQKIKKLVIGDTVEDLEYIGKSLQKLRYSGIENKQTTVVDLIKTIVSNNTNKQQDSSWFENILKELGLTLAQGPEQDRIARYKEYERIIEKIPYMKRALKVLTQNICYPEDYTNDIFKISLPDTDKKYKVDKDNIFNLIKYHKLNEDTSEIIFNCLLYGDYFTEIVITDDILKKYNLLQESYVQSSWFKFNLKDREFKITVESVNRNTINKILEKEKDNNKQVMLIHHTPNRVIKLGDQQELGYLVFNVDVTELNYAHTNLDIHGQQIEKLVSSIMLRIRRNVDIKNEINTKEELKSVLVKLILSSKSNEFTIRYVPPELMQHFKLDEGVNKFKPYGTSILYGTEYLSKIIIAIQGSIMVQRITRSVDRQVIYVDVGSSRDVRKYIEGVKEAIQRRRFTIDGVKVDDIPSLVSSYEYIYLPTKEGRRYVEFDQWSQQGDTASRVDDLKVLRDALVASIEVPPAYIGIEENIEARATLVEQSVVFATTVMNYQRSFAKHIKDLIVKIARVSSNISEDSLNQLQIHFQPPLSLLVERQANYFDNVSRIVETGSNLGIPKQYFINKYFFIDRDDIEELNIQNSLNKIITKQKEEGEEGGFGGGGFEDIGGGEEGGGEFGF